MENTVSISFDAWAIVYKVTRREMIKTLTILLLVVGAAIAEPIHKPIDPHYTEEELESLDAAHLLEDLFADNGEKVENYIDMSGFSESPAIEDTEPFTNIDDLAANLPGDLLSTVKIFKIHAI